MTLTQLFVCWAGWISFVATIVTLMLRREMKTDVRRKDTIDGANQDIRTIVPALQPICRTPELGQVSEIYSDAELIRDHDLKQIKVLAPSGAEVLGVWKYECRRCHETILRHSPLKLTDGSTETNIN